MKRWIKSLVLEKSSLLSFDALSLGDILRDGSIFILKRTWNTWIQMHTLSPSKCHKLLALRLSVTPKKTWIFSNTAVRTSNHIQVLVSSDFYKILFQNGKFINYTCGSWKSWQLIEAHKRLTHETNVSRSRFRITF